MRQAQSIDARIANYVSFLSDKKKKAVLTVVKTFAEDETNLWDEMPDEIKKSVEKGMQESDKGLGKPHAEVMKKHKKWLKK